jgi:heat-inducible transcriptional repressor
MAAEPLTARQAELLRAVCREYLLCGHEVASASLARGSGRLSAGWSSATIRNELAVLERRGFVVRPHRSAGCRPTSPGLAHYVRSLPVAASPRPELARAVDRSLEGDASPEQSVRSAVHVLAEVAGCVAVSFVGDARAGIVESLEVVPLVGARALVVLGFRAGSTSVHPVHVDRLAERSTALGSDLGSDLLALQARLRGLCIGRTLEQAHAEIVRLQADVESRVDGLLAEALHIGLALCTLGAFDPLWLHVAGQSSLARELLQRAAAVKVAEGTDFVADVLTRLEDYRRLADVLCQILPAPGSADPRVEVLLGGSDLLGASASTTGPSDASDHDDAALRLAVVGCRLPADAEGPSHASSGVGPTSTRGAPGSLGVVRMGAVALVGIDRMDYAEVVPLVEYAAKALAARTCA